MHSTDFVDRDFLLLDADAAVSTALAAIEATRARTVLVRRARPDAVAWFVFSRRSVRGLLRNATARQLGTAVKLHARAPATPASASGRLRPGRDDQVVLAGRHPVGFIAALATERGGAAVFRGGAPIFSGDMMAADAMAGAADVDGGAASAVVSRQVAATWPASVTSGGTLPLVVSLASLGAGAVVSASLPLPVGATLDIVVVAIAGVKLTGSGSGTLRVSEPQDHASLLFQFTSSAPGLGRARVYAFLAGRSIAALELSTEIVAERQPLASHASEGAVATVPVTARTPPDLALLVVETGKQILYRLQGAKAGGGMREYPPVPTPNGSREFFAQFAQGIENLAVHSVEARATAGKKMCLWGANLFQNLLPAELRKTLWDLRERVSTVQVTSDEAWIPWEVCRLVGQDAQGRNVEDTFFAERFAVTRWLHGTAAPERFRFREWALVVPGNSGLPLASAEEAYVLACEAPGRRVTKVPARFADVTAAMESERFDAWHFCGHANAGTQHDGDKAAIELEGRESFTADLFTGRVENALRTRPFVFLNACQSAQGAPSLTGVGGWAHRFIRPTFRDAFAASVFIGSYWSVYDTAAHGFATGLYERLLKDGLPIGDAVRNARLAALSDKDPLSWLAYTVYADPSAKADRSES